MSKKVPKCPKCPNPDCEQQMKPDRYGVCKCPKCKAAYIPGDVPGFFVPLSIIGIHEP